MKDYLNKNLKIELNKNSRVGIKSIIAKRLHPINSERLN